MIYEEATPAQRIKSGISFVMRFLRFGAELIALPFELLGRLISFCVLVAWERSRAEDGR